VRDFVKSEYAQSRSCVVFKGCVRLPSAPARRWLVETQGPGIGPSNCGGQQSREQPAALGALLDGQERLVSFVVRELGEKALEESCWVGVCGKTAVVVCGVLREFECIGSVTLRGNRGHGLLARPPLGQDRVCCRGFAAGPVVAVEVLRHSVEAIADEGAVADRVSALLTNRSSVVEHMSIANW
jgi:hypothetical protein